MLEYDNVLNHQRGVVYERRRKILLGGSEAVEEYLNVLKVQPQIGKEVEPSGHAFSKAVDDKKKQLGDNFHIAIQRLILQTIDLYWVEHLEVMDYRRGSMNLRAYGQRDPLVEYKKEGLKMFKEMEERIVSQVMNVFPHVGGTSPIQEQIRLQEVHEQAQLIGSGDEESDSKHQGNVSRSSPTNPDGSKVGRNDACPCGAKKSDGTPIKYKHCHGK